MKALPKITALLLMLCLVCGLIGCANAKTETEAGSADGNTPETETNFYGYEVIYSHAPDMNIPAGSPFGFLENTSFADAAMKRVNDLEKTYNCDIQLIWDTTSSMASAVNNSVAAMTRHCDVVDVEDGIILDMAKGGSLIPYQELTEYIDMYDFNKWGAPNIYECVMYKGSLYGLRSNLWPNRYPSFGVPIIFSGDLVKEGGYEDPREFVENKTWDRELMLQMIKDCTVTENGETKVFGMAVDTAYIFQLCLSAKGETFFKYENGICTNNTESDKITEAISWVQNMLTENASCFVNNAKAGAREVFMNPFLEGKAAMFMHMTWALFSTVAMQVENWGLLPYPTGIEEEYGEWASYYAGNRNYVALTLTVDEPDIVGFIIDKMYEPLEGFDSAEALKTYYTENVFFDERDYDLYFDLCGNCRYMYWANGGYTLADYFKSSFSKVTATEGIEKNRSQVDKLIEEYVTPNQELYTALEAAYEQSSGK